MFSVRTRCYSFLMTGVLFLASAYLYGQTRLLRFPDLHGDRVVFSYAGDLWTASTEGGLARRLTAHPGVEFFAKFSPDGSSIAFTGQYDGDEQVYVMPSNGGVPEQLTFYPARGPLPPRWGYDNQVYGWTRDGKAVLFRSIRDSFDLGDSRLYTISIEGGLPEPLPMPTSGAGELSPDGKKVIYSPLFRDFRTWKRYQGGWAQDLYVFDLTEYEVSRITDHPRSDRDPMWIGNTIYFTSDRDGKLNLYAYELDSGETRQLTQNRQWDVRWPSADEEGRIVYERNGELRILDTRNGQDREISIDVPDDGLNARPSRISAARNIEDFELSPAGERALFVARGDIFSAPIEKGFTSNLTKSSGTHEKWARWSPDGSKISFISDQTGEEEIYLVNHDGSGEVQQLTSGGSAMRYAPEWSPEGSRLAFSDKEGKLYVLEVESRRMQEIADEARGQVGDYTWSPGGDHLAFSLSDESGFNSIYVWSAADGQLHRVTGELFNEFNPAWDPEGNYLYYLADREYAPQIGSFEWNYALDRETAIYVLALRKDVSAPFPPENDEVKVEKQETDAASEEPEKKAEEEEKDEQKKIEKKPVEIDFDGLALRVARVPVEPDNYQGLSAAKGRILYVRSGPFYYGRQSDIHPELRTFDLKERKEKTVAERISGYALSHDGSKVLVRQNNAFKLYESSGNGKPKEVSTRGLQVDRVPVQEWEQIFDEVWRRFRDFFYVENMHGYDWEAIREQYRPWLKHVRHRSDLNYVLGEMVAELNVSHAYISGGDFEIPDRPKVALPGARFELDPESNRYRISRIFAGQNEEDRFRSPLTEIGVNVSAGEYVLAIDGEPLSGNQNPYQLLRHKADRPVRLTVNSSPSEEGAREVTFQPRSSETDLIYLDWVTRKRNQVTEMTGGRVGYLHVPDMGANGIREFIKYFYGQIRKEGLIVDVRGNGGGNVSQMLIERLRRDLLGTRFSRTSDTPGTYPGTVFYGPMAAILNETSASDGDIFPYMFRQAGLGPLIGKRSWGGVIGITNRGTLIDGGTVNVPEFGTNAPDGSWVIENQGVAPDIEVENDPKSVIEGRDPQLERAVQEVMKRIQEDPKQLPSKPPPPVKTP